MTVPMPDPYLPGAPLPDPTARTFGTRWASSPPADHLAAPSDWADADPPAAVPPAIEPVTMRVGWLTAARPYGAD